ncbi:MAG: hypothetical protein A2289_03180 [Deltaproteobacteria bacterium RIFOXYA12_FULL_58_15]|nr:MAG: hypothetical protein A2289_03180 [Deltaproteobacteria bacterium RIFOXYA12_FULL_58_15]
MYFFRGACFVDAFPHLIPGVSGQRMQRAKLVACWYLFVGLRSSAVQQFSIYHVQIVGRSDKLRQRSYAISLERKVKHPAVVAICEVARKSFT